MAIVTVHIIESPSADDFLDDRREGVALNAALSHAQIKSRLHTVVDTKHFAMALGRALAHHHSQAPGDSIPIIHLSMHGNATGIALTSGEGLEWDTLRCMLQLTNNAVGGVLLVAMSTCHGFKAADMARVEDSLPFLALVGPNDGVAWRDTVAAFVAFYHYLVRSNGKISRATELMNAVLARTAPLFEMCTGAAVQAEYREEIRRARTLSERIERAKEFAEQFAQTAAVHRGWMSIVEEIQRAADEVSEL